MILKHRAWDKRCKMMSVNGHFDYTEGRTTLYFSLEGVLFVDSRNNTIDMLHSEAKNRYVVMQATGLKDKNGVEAFKADIVKSANRRIWIIKHGTYFWKVPNDCIELYGFYFQCIKDKNCCSPIYEGFGEIIGNVHQNPELLEG